MSSLPVLDVSGLGRRYGELEALHDLNLEVHAGECVAVIGHNGSGKTTAVRLIAGQLDPSAGSIHVEGAPVDQEVEAIEARAALALVPDTPSLYDDLTVREHLQLVAVAHGVNEGLSAAPDGGALAELSAAPDGGALADAGLEARIEELLGGLGLAEKLDATPGTLSRGMRQKVQLACALIRPWRLLVLDEPVVGLDPASQRTLRELLLEAKRAGKAVVLTTHQLEFARGVADRAVVLSEGAVVADGPYDEIVDGAVVREYGLL
ncbi:MAG TPA: ABC transporter ATP-binding protein [Solirubrobacteraceae bacterium]|nr:ABC transporter ATP-binding protein [Solirubrobacteraceae bacterium]